MSLGKEQETFGKNCSLPGLPMWEGAGLPEASELRHRLSLPRAPRQTAPHPAPWTSIASS